MQSILGWKQSKYTTTRFEQLTRQSCSQEKTPNDGNAGHACTSEGACAQRYRAISGTTNN